MTHFTPPTTEELQAKFPQYHVEKFIAQGGMGAVYLARQVSLDRPVAIKILPEEFGKDADYRTSFATEAKAMAKLNHVNLVGIFDFGEVDGMLYIVMEYVPGRNLFNTAHGQAVNELEAARLIADMCEGLDHAHKAGLIHRDIKPANVLLDDEARPKIVDFGLARPSGEEQTEGVVFGTPGYTAPEVLSNPRAVDQRSDIFSMGVMLYELLTGSMPSKAFIPASKKNATDLRFDKVISKAIHPNPAMRYKHAGDMAKELDELIANFDQGADKSKLVSQSATLSPMLAAGSRGGALGGAVSGLNSPIRPVSKVAVKRSKGGLFVSLILLFVVGAVAFWLVSEKKKGEEQQAAQEKARELAAKAREAELERERVLAAEEKERQEQERLRREQEQRAEQQRLEELEREKQRKAEAAMQKKKEREREQKRKKALAAAKRKAKKKPSSDFDAQGFYDKADSVYQEELAQIDKEEKEVLSDEFDRFERELKRHARKIVKGKRGRELQDRVEKYMERVRERGEVIDFPGKVHDGLEKMKNKILKEYRGKIKAAREPFNEKRKNALNELKVNLKEQIDQLKEEGDSLGAKRLQDLLDAAK